MKRFLFLFLLACTLVISSHRPVSAREPITISMPAATVRQTIAGILPLPLEQKSDRFTGSITIDSIRSLVIGKNSVRIEAQVSGRNMEVTTNIGGQDIKLKLGKLVLPVTCDVRLRFDPRTKTLFLRPQFHKPTHGSSNSAKTLVPLLNGLGNKEYPVRLNHLSPLSARVGNKTISVHMQPVDIRATDNLILLKLQPVTGKSR